MALDDQDHLELMALCNALVDETISSEQLDRLQQWLRDSEDARHLYVRFMEQDAGLCGHAAEMQTDPADASSDRAALDNPESDGRRWHLNLRPLYTRMRASLWLRISSVVGTVVLLVVFLFSQSTRDTSQPDSQAASGTQVARESLDSGVAVLTRIVGAVWDQEAPPSIGDTLPPTVLRLSSGLAQIEFYSGAVMLLEGPAELELLSPDRCFCRMGKLRMTVPRAAQGFTVLSPEIEAVDLGTEFGLEVAPQGKTEVHVFDGKVELYAPGPQRATESRIELLAGNGQHIERSGDSYAIRATPKTFVSMQDLRLRTEEVVARRDRSWRQHTQALIQDPRVVALYNFDQDRDLDRVLHNHGIQGASLDGAIVGCEWSKGRWSGKDALEFKRPGDRVCIEVPGEYDALTLAGWVRVDGLDRAYSSLILTDGWELGEVHWQILRSGQLRIGVCHLREPEMVGGRFGFGFDYDSPIVWRLSQIGQWMHVAVVVDNLSNSVTHFADGRVLSIEPLHKNVKFRIGAAQIGNWRPYTDKAHKSPVPIRNFNGRIDELLIVGQALSEEEIQTLYQEGKPGMMHE